MSDFPKKELNQNLIIDRRSSHKLMFAFAVVALSTSSFSEELIEISDNTQKRGSQRGVYIDQQDFPYFTGRYPPRVLDYDALPKQDGNKTTYNAWGSCVENSCQYVPLKQRYDGYNKYQASILAGTAALDGPLRAAAIAGAGAAWPATAEAELVRALRRGVLLGNVLLISANYGTSNEALIARFYINEAYYALTTLAAAARLPDGAAAAAAAWRLARDSWNSYLAVINRAIVPKVGTRFPALAGDL